MDVVVVAFPGNQFSGSILRGLNDLVQVRTVALLDLMFVDKDVDGAVGSMELAEIPDKYGSALVDASGAPGGLLEPGQCRLSVPRLPRVQAVIDQARDPQGCGSVRPRYLTDELRRRSWVC